MRPQLMVVASLGDAIDGLVARRSGTVSVGGALLDASGDRYQEFFFLGGLAMFFRGSSPALMATLAALAGSFMVSYSSAKAEALRVPVPPGVMRRAERAVCLCLATVLTAVWLPWSDSNGLPGWAGALPVLVAVSLIAVVGNISAVRRLRFLARRASDPTPLSPRRPGAAQGECSDGSRSASWPASHRPDDKGESALRAVRAVHARPE